MTNRIYRIPKKPPKIGMRTVKTSIAVAICILIAAIFNYPAPFYACIAATFSLRITTEQSITFGKARLLGTLIGGSVGLVLITIQNSLPFVITPYMQIITVPLSIILALVICNIFHQDEASCSVCCIVLLAVMLVHQKGDSYYYAISRTIETAVGVVVAVIVNKYINFSKH